MGAAPSVPKSAGPPDVKVVPCMRFVPQFSYGGLLNPHRTGEQDWDGEILSPTWERLRHSQAVLEGNKEPKVFFFFFFLHFFLFLFNL